MEFLSVNFSPQARARIVAAEIKAKSLISNPGDISFSYTEGMPDDPQVWIVFRYIMTVFAAVGHEACELGRNGTWAVDEVDRQSRQFLRSFALYTRAAYDLPEIVTNMGYVRPVIQKVFESFPQWKAYRDELLEVADLLSGSAPVSAPMIASSESLPGTQAADEVHRRATLLEQYKEATGDPSNRQIYTAKNSNIHKPQFYEWRDGRLSSDSQTCQNFERFLREKKPPTPKER